MKTIYSLFTLALVLLSQIVSAQDVYYTQKARIIITVQVDGNEIQFNSNELLAMLDYETAKFKLSIDPSTLVSENDSLNNQLKNFHNQVIVLEGKFAIESLNTKGHPPLDFDFTAELMRGNTIIEGKAHLEHIANRTYYACVLSINFSLMVDELKMNSLKWDITGPIKIDIIQAVLPRDTD